MSQVEAELRSVCKVKPEKFTDRQNYLAALCRHISDKLTEDQFKALSDGAFEWYEMARQAKDKDLEVPEFLDHEPLDEVPNQTTIDAMRDAKEGNLVEFDPSSLDTPVKSPRSRTGVPRYDVVTGEKDKWGIVKGTKTSDAMAMLEKGAKMGDVKKALGANYYNALSARVKEGHCVEKLPNSIIKLTHRDEVGK